MRYKMSANVDRQTNNTFNFDIHIGDGETEKSAPVDIHLRRYKEIKFDDFLTISSSAQPSEEGFNILHNKLSENTKLVVIDVRQEPHFFLNGTPISGPRLELTGAEILEKEKTLLESLKNEGKISIQKKVDRSQGKKEKVVEDQPLQDGKLCLEEELIKKRSEDDTYVRIPIESGVVVIAEETIDQLIKIVLEAKNGEKSVRIHTHCSCGRKRSWQSLAHLSFILYSKTMDSSAIFEQLRKIGNVDDIKQPLMSKKHRSRPSAEYWETFHQFCATQELDKISWSAWKKDNPVPENSQAKFCIV